MSTDIETMILVGTVHTGRLLLERTMLKFTFMDGAGIVLHSIRISFARAMGYVC
jgi:hypothetical protein